MNSKSQTQNETIPVMISSHSGLKSIARGTTVLSAGDCITVGSPCDTHSTSYTPKSASASDGETTNLALLSNDALKEREAACQRRKEECSLLLDSVKDSLQSIRAELCFRLHGVKIGSHVYCGGKKYLVFRVRVDDWDDRMRPWVLGRCFKKDGTLSKQVRYLFRDWKIA